MPAGALSHEGALTTDPRGRGPRQHTRSKAETDRHVLGEVHPRGDDGSPRNAPRTRPPAWPCGRPPRGMSLLGTPPSPSFSAPGVRPPLRTGVVWTVGFESEAAAGVDDYEKIIQKRSHAFRLGDSVNDPAPSCGLGERLPLVHSEGGGPEPACPRRPSWKCVCPPSSIPRPSPDREPPRGPEGPCLQGHSFLLQARRVFTQSRHPRLHVCC